MNGKYILSLDQGTTSSRAIIFDYHGEIKAQAQQEFPQIYPNPGYVEHDPTEILTSQVGVIPEALIRAKIQVKDIAAIGITNQRETTIVWNKHTGEPIYNAIVWQCRRTDEYCKQLINDGCKDFIYNKTGLVIDAYFSATKIKWILDHVKNARSLAEKGDLLFGTIDTFLMWKLSNGKIFATDYTNASRTMLFNIHTLTWDDELLTFFNIPKSMMPEVHPSSYYYGETDESYFGKKIPITGVVGDQQASLFGQLCINQGEVKNTYGTGCFMLANTGNKAVKSKHGLITTIAACLSNQKPNYVLEGSIFVGGAIVQWLRDEMRLIKTADETERYALSVDSSNGVYIIPSFVGLGAPYWRGDVKGMIYGLTRGTKKEHFIRAALESIDYQVYDIYKAMEEDLGVELKSLCVDGGASKNNFLLQFQADILNCIVKRPKVTEVTALGAAYLAGLEIKYWNSIDDIKNNKVIEREFYPSGNQEKNKNRIDGYHRAIKMVCSKE